ncbi:cobalt/nickel transport system permease protein [Ruminiclostridium sufflavum DSM 19573]|uniref:Cobalt/nickel transport system permease protein n=1 Tax=Ruminiclostridium sufflavum DSM 19573 TaxID=1121337 RepID=A0A318XPN9_9FIRM|nr:cobalt transporter CbiM [Ruminiclostridium sufflavum]PYG89150.1 cobalt/nickel transport system permease protein [Ruminiclostridium sufflavum DSM 19573]
MHIPDNYLSPSTCAVMGAAMVPVWTIAVRKVREEVSKVRIPLLGIGSAFSFLMMMFNVPLPGGTTGHAVGGTLLAILLGPYSACISVTVALLIQALMFGDGGILAFGANCFNMAFVLPFMGYFVYKFIKDRVKSEKGEYAAIVIGSYLGINAAALLAAIEFGIQPVLFKSALGQPLYCPYPLSASIPAMTIPHLLVAGIVEAVFTVAVFAFVKKVSPGTIYEGSKQKIKAVYGLVAALILLTPIGLLATGTAWGEWGADEIKDVVSGGNTLGFIPEGMKNGFSFEAVMPDYTINGLPEIAGYIVSAAAGAAIFVILFKIIAGIKKNNADKGR